MGTVEFASADAYPFADVIYKLIVGGFVNAVSVGFLPIEYSFVENDPDRGWGIDFKRQELLEISVVPVPANQNALLAQARSLGLRDTHRLRRSERAIVREYPRSRAEDLQRAFLVRSRIAALRRIDPREPEPEPWMVEYMARERREADERLARARQLQDAIRLSIPSW